MNLRRICAILGAAFAVGTVVFVSSLSSSVDRQAECVAARLLKQVPVPDGVNTVSLTVDYRPENRVMQGPPMMANIAVKDGVEGVVVTKSFFAQRKLLPPPVGETLTFVGRNGAYKVKISGFIDWDRPVRGYPNMFVSPETARTIREKWEPHKAMSAKDLAPMFKSDAGRNFDMAKALLLWAAALTALCLIVNALLISIESSRREIALLRVAGLSRACAGMKVFGESLFLCLSGALLGSLLSVGAIYAYVSYFAAEFPEGAAVSVKSIVLSFAAAPALAVLAGLFALRKALSVKPLEAASAKSPNPGIVGMVVAFAFGFGAFVAIEVWGASLMSSFIPSRQWTDAIVSILPKGVSSFDIEKLKKLPEIKSVAELQPLQVFFDPLEEVPQKKSASGGKSPRGRGRGKAYRNALLLASDIFPKFEIISPANEKRSIAQIVSEPDKCVITEMMSRAHKLKVGDEIKLTFIRGGKYSLKVAAIADVNWHMVTSRGLVRGLGRMPVHTDGPVFVSFDTLAAVDMRPQEMVGMTHLWLDYNDEFLRKNGYFEAGRLTEKSIVAALGGAWHKDKKGNVAGNTVRLHNRDEIADGTLAHGNSIIGEMAKIPFIFIVVICTGFVSLALASADARKNEFVLLRAAGATRGYIVLLLTWDMLKVALWGIVWGLVAGAGAGWLFTFATRAGMSAWGLPAAFAVPWREIAVGILLSLLFSLAMGVPSSVVAVLKKGKIQGS
jgi:ABC-type lipoprotein release transport system permease subunit